ncbi:MAG: hypothetical protein WD055_04620 [Candidatus Dependentiae bacterium]
MKKIYFLLLLSQICLGAAQKESSECPISKYITISSFGNASTHSRTVLAEQNGPLQARGSSDGYPFLKSVKRRNADAELLPHTVEILHVAIKNPGSRYSLHPDYYLQKFIAAYDYLIKEQKPVKPVAIQVAAHFTIKDPIKHPAKDPHPIYSIIGLCLGLTKKNKEGKHLGWVAIEKFYHTPVLHTFLAQDFEDCPETQLENFKVMINDNERKHYGFQGTITATICRKMFERLAKINNVPIDSISVAAYNDSDTDD